MTIRIIPRLDIKGSNLVKGVHLEGLRVLGKPERFARFYYEQGADELIYMDIVASLYNRNNLAHIVEKTSREIFIPLTVGGGLRTLEDVRHILHSGADKVALNTAVIAKPELIREAASRFGSSTIVVSIEVIKQPHGGYECYTDNGRVPTGLDAVEWAQRAEELGAGEILVTSIDKEGTGKGYDVALTRRIADLVSIPVIACGGAGQIQHIRDVIVEGHADAVVMASVLHYRAIWELEHQQQDFTEGNVNFLMSREGYSKVQAATLSEIKSYLGNDDIKTRRMDHAG